MFFEDRWVGTIFESRADQTPMNDTTLPTTRTGDPDAVATLARTIYREFRAGGFNERDVMALAGELLDLVARDVGGDRSPQHG